MASLGEKLRQAREAKNMQLRDVADNTRIALNYLAAIENDDYSSLPGGVFNKGFVRSFAKVVGVNDQEALADYNELMARQAPVTLEEETPPTSRKRDVYMDEPSGSPFLRIAAALVVLALVGAGIYFGLQYWQNRNNPVNVATTATPTPQPSPATTINANNSVAPNSNNAPSNNNSNAAPAASPLAPGGELKVQLTAAQLVNITPTVDGKQQPAFNLNPNEPKEFTAQQGVRVRMSKYLINEVQLTINGRPAKFTPNPGRPGQQSVEMEITRDNFQQFVQQ